VRVDQREEMTRPERFARDATMRVSSCVSADEFGAMCDGRVAALKQTMVWHFGPSTRRLSR
jgi:hypothetical protein